MNRSTPKEILYKKVGRKYVPCREYDHAMMSTIPLGFTMLHARGDMTSYHYRIDPANAPVAAALVYLKDAIQTAMTKATELDIDPKLVKDEKFMKAYKEFTAKTKGTIIGRYNSRSDIVDAGMKVIENYMLKETNDNAR
jgi:hypothetical protein